MVRLNRLSDGRYVIDLLVRTYHAMSLHFQNLISRSPVTGDADVDVTLTTHGARIDTVHITIESISRGRSRPKTLSLFVSDDLPTSTLPRTLRRLAKRGLSINAVPDVGPHTKYHPHLSNGPFSRPLVTADDDVIYGKAWLADLVNAHLETPNVIVAHRAHVFVVRDSKPDPYHLWPSAADTEPSLRNFGTGVGGVLYPAAYLEHLKLAGMGFLNLCPKADDVWLHAIAVGAGFQTRQVRAYPIAIRNTPGSQTEALNTENVASRRNDLYISNVYSDRDFAAIEQSV